MKSKETPIYAVDFFCGAGGLSLGLKQAGIKVLTGIDLDSSCEYPFTKNLGAVFLKKDVREISGSDVSDLFPKGAIRLLAGCAPCQPFSKHRKGADTSEDEKWDLLDEFSRVVIEVLPEYVTMENVPGLAATPVFKRFRSALLDNGYSVDHKICFCPEYGLAQYRRRLVLVASRIGPIKVPSGAYTRERFRTVRDVIAKLPQVRSGGTHKTDGLHKARALTEINLSRVRASKPGGTWSDWPEALRAPCHRRKSGASFQSVYARMEWDKPSPTITTQSYNFGTGRFGHPTQARAITLREAAMLQGFPKTYKFTTSDREPEFTSIGRLIGNAVPPPLAKAIGKRLMEHASATLV